MKRISNSPPPWHRPCFRVACLVALICGAAAPLDRASADVLLPAPADQPFTPPIKVQRPDGTNGYSIVAAANPAAFAQATFVNVPPGYSITNGPFRAWCADAPTLIYPREYSPGWFTVYKPVFYHSYDTAALQAAGLPADSTMWSKVNYIINNKPLWAAIPANVSEIQAAIWRLTGYSATEEALLLGGTLGYGLPAGTVAKVEAIVADTNANGATFVPGPGQLVAVVMAFPAALQTGMTPSLLEGIEGQLNIIEVESPKAMIGDLVWNDLNANGVQDGGLEVGIDGVTVELFTSGGTSVGTTTTAGGGLYGFTVAPGDYYVVFSNLPPGFALSPSTPGSASDPSDSDANPVTGMTDVTTLVAGENDPTWDAGIYRPAKLGDFVWLDQNANGAQDSGEPGIDGVTVKLLDAANTVLATTVTGDDPNTAGTQQGYYEFTGLLPGVAYHVEFVNPDAVGPDAYAFSPRQAGGDPAQDSDGPVSDGVTLAAGEFNPTLDAGLYRPGSVHVFGFLDSNGNGTLDLNETAFPDEPGKTIELKDGNGTLISTKTTANGVVNFEGLAPGTYSVTENPVPGGYTLTTPVTVTVTISSGEEAVYKLAAANLPAGDARTEVVYANLVFGNAPLAKLGDFVWNDLNHDGIQDSGEPGIPGVVVTLNGPGGTQTTTTDANGLYQFTDLLPGTYTVTVGAPPAGFVGTLTGAGTPATDSNASPTTVTLEAGDSDQTIDFGFWMPASLGDFVWNDLNHDGIQDVGEPGIPGVTVALDGPGGPQTTTTDSDGFYQFTGLIPGTYTVTVGTPPAGFVGTLTGAGTPDTDSNASPTTVTLAAGDSDQTIDFGFFVPLGPCLEMTKTANKTTVAPYEPVIYTYVVHNCGGTTLTDIVVTDDNGTPGLASDDFTVGTVATLAPGESATLTATVIPVVTTIGVVNGATVNAGSVIVVTSLINGDIKVTYLQDFGINDNTYGTGAIGWPSGHKFGDLTGSDKLEFRFFDKNGTMVLDFYVDTLTAASKVTVPGTGQVINYPSGYGTLGAFGGDGKMVAGDKNNIVTFSTSLSDNLNNPLNLPNKAALILNSPTSLVAGDVVIDPVKAPGGWDPINSYTVVVKASTFAAGGGFGAVAVPDQHNSPNKLGGPNGMTTTVTDSTVTNTATATSGTLIATATETVAIVSNPASLSGFVYVDADNSGTKDAGETPIAGVTVTLTGTDTLGAVNQTTTTDAAGFYSFTALLPGTYAITESQPAAYYDGKDAIGSQGGTTGNDVLSNIVLAAGVNGVQNNFGEVVPVPPASVSGFVYFDPNNNGIKEPGEAPIAGATLTLTGTDDLGNEVTMTATSDGLGAYSFTNLRPGTYQVSETQPAPYLDGMDAVGTVNGSANGTLAPPDALDAIILAAGDNGIDYNFGEIDSSVPVPNFTLVKSASSASAPAYQPVTYSYTVTNTGGTTLTGIVVTDDNGTPDLPSDDFTVGTIDTLDPGDSATLTATVIPVVSTIGVVNGATVYAGAVIVTVPQANGDIKVTYLQDFGINDNTYGTGSIGWSNGHKFGELTGSDKLEFRFFDKNGTMVLDFYMDTLTSASSVTVPGTGQVISYPSGYGTLGPFGGDGKIVAGDKNNIVSFSTSLSDNLNNPLNLPNKAALIVNSPTSLVEGDLVVDPVKAPGGWDPINSYTVVVKASTFAAGGGFGSVAVPDQHNSPNKLGGPNGMATTVTDSTVVNTATASAAGLTATATAAVAIESGSGTPPAPSLPSPWATQDIGPVGAVGSASYASGIFTVMGSGNDLGGKDGKDEFRYVEQSASGDCTMEAKVLTIQNTNNAAAAGVMIREALTETSRFAGVFVTAGGGIQFRYRKATGGAMTTKTVAGLVAPHWVKVTRVGNMFTAYRSVDGITWTKVDQSVSITMGAGVSIGLAVNSKKDGTLCTATFDQVTVTP